MLPSILAKELQKGIIDYIDTTFPMANEPFRGSLKEMLSKEKAVYHEPYIAVKLPFRSASKAPDCFEAIKMPFTPHLHQARAFERLCGEDGRSTLVATGTGSGKTECFMYPVLDYCYRHRGESGIKALIIYPMNALATDQAKRIAAEINGNPLLKGNITAGMYVGGKEKTPSREMQDDWLITDHDTMLNRPPDILLTNYKMLDYLLLRPLDAALWEENGPETLRYIVVDELHTFDGAQGTDLACLLRRLKTRLTVPPGYLCCVGTSATMGGADSAEAVKHYAEEVFGEPFESDAVITEDRISAAEFFAGTGVFHDKLPTFAEVEELKQLVELENEGNYLQAAVKSWLPDFAADVLTPHGRLLLAEELKTHSFFQALLRLMAGRYCQFEYLTEALREDYPGLRKPVDSEALLASLFALVSQARIGTEEKLRPFLNVQVQLWMRELRRLMAMVSETDVRYKLAAELTDEELHHYLPVVNCRDCGATGWVTVLDKYGNGEIHNLPGFYNTYFRGDDKVAMLFPFGANEKPRELPKAKLCPNCLQVVWDDGEKENCPHCGKKMISVYLPTVQTSGTKAHQQYVCPVCNSRRGLALMGLRSATEISATLSQIFASKFNDDKKLLAFSDNVQDAAHRAGFFNARTWRFGLRTAIQHYVNDGGAGRSLADFQAGMVDYWQEKMVSKEDFVSYFIAPNMTWERAYEKLQKIRKLGSDNDAKKLVADIIKRVQYEILLEYGVCGKIGRTLEKSGCSVLYFAPEDIAAVALRVQERAVNEIGKFGDEPLESFERMAAGYWQLLRSHGAFADEVFTKYLKEKGNNFLLTQNVNTGMSWMPGVQSGRNTPKFLLEKDFNGKHRYNFDTIRSNAYVGWLQNCTINPIFADDSNWGMLSQILIEELLKQQVVSELLDDNGESYEVKVYGLNKDRVYVSSAVKQLRCDECSSLLAVAVENIDYWEGTCCLRNKCSGHLHVEEGAALDYYGHLFSDGDLSRINAREHTGLLERDDRENLETDFKRNKDDSRLWDPNVLSCTPTLEMGIDIGDLSTVVLCSVPPGEAQFLQRAGRAGRKDGNALTLAVANTKPHDLYYYSEPLEMIDGSVNPPKIFLKASAVLARQFMAFCMDTWVKQSKGGAVIPENVGDILGKLKKRPKDMFPFNFLADVQMMQTRRLNAFLQMFAGELGESEQAELREFVRGSGTEASPMYLKMLESFEDLNRQRDAIRENIKDLKNLIKELEARPDDSSTRDQIAELKAEISALRHVVYEMKKKNVFNFLSDEGLLPNYAFPEAGIILKAILLRRPEKKIQGERRKYEKLVYEYTRAAASAISEFAPNNCFYAGGRQYIIDQVDMRTTQVEMWRLCPNCAHAELENAVMDRAACPKCGDNRWADKGQVRLMLRVNMVYSTMDYQKNYISDDSDNRMNTFYCKQLLVDVDENSVAAAYKMDNDDFPFGYEFAGKAVLREINFGESELLGGEKLSVDGIEEIRNGFKVCRHCGMVQTKEGGIKHKPYCKAKEIGALQNDPVEDCLYLYREFPTEVLRLLIPATTFDSSRQRTESFTAAFMLGMKQYFGNVDHLRATVCEVPVRGEDYRKQYLVVYDSVPGGTGYLKQLMQNEDALLKVFEQALEVLEACHCHEEGKDGCYHCIYAYRLSSKIGDISRSTAIRLLRAIISGKGNIEKIDHLSDIPTNSLFDSELEGRFIGAIEHSGNEKRQIEVTKDFVRGKAGYYLRINNTRWEIEPQARLGLEEGFTVWSQPDFIIWPKSQTDKKPVAVFTDGFTFHKDIAAKDTLKREAIRRHGGFRVWSLSYKDVESVFANLESYATGTLIPEAMPLPQMFNSTVKAKAADSLGLATKTSPFELLLWYLEEPEAERILTAQAEAYALALLKPSEIKNEAAFSAWQTDINQIIECTSFSEREFSFGDAIFGTWQPRENDARLTMYAGISQSELKKNPEASVTVSAVLRDNDIDDVYAKEWNGFWQFFNVMQFAKEFSAVTTSGIDTEIYASLPLPKTDELQVNEFNPWNEIMEMVFDDEVRSFAKEAMKYGIDPPDEVGLELDEGAGEIVIELAWSEKKLCYLTEEQLEKRELVEQLGWKVIEEITENNKSLFRGEEA